MEENELTECDIFHLERHTNGNKNAGMLVETKTGASGRTYNHEALVNGKVKVYCTNGDKLLCDPTGLTLKGYID